MPDPTPLDELSSLGIREVLDADSRPTFVIDLDPDDERANGIAAIFSNTSLRQHERLFDAIIGREAKGLGHDGGTMYDDFRSWATGVTPHDDSKDVYPLSFSYADLLWTGSTIRRRWRVVSGNRLWRADAHLNTFLSEPPLEVAAGGATVEQETDYEGAEAPLKPSSALVGDVTLSTAVTRVGSPAGGAQEPQSPPAPRVKPAFYPDTSGSSSNETGTSSSRATSTSISLTAAPEKGITDWTAAKIKGGPISAHIKFARSVNWAETPLGPMSDWSPEFRQAANLTMGNPHPAALFWGSELTMLYNEAYAAEVAGNKHPSLMGTGFSGPFSELWDYAGPIFAECARTGTSVRKDDDYLPIDRRNLLEETFFCWSFTPLYGGKSKILGFYNAPFDTTDHVVNTRRMQTITRMGDRTGKAKNVKQFWQLVLEGLSGNHRDVPFAILYSVGGDDENQDLSSISSGSTISTKCCHLEGAIAVPEGHAAAPQQLDLRRNREGFVPAFRQAMRIRQPILLHTRDGSLPESLLTGVKWRGFGDPCERAIVFPVRPTNGDTVLAFLVVGVNPRRPYDANYQSFVTMLNRQLSTSLASIILFEDEVRRSRDAAEAAALEKEKLTQELELQNSRLRRMTELSPLGMFLISPDGVLREANDCFYDMTGHTRSNAQYEMSWIDTISETSLKTITEGWEKLTKEHAPWSGELQLKKRAGGPVNLQGEAIEYWVMFTAHSEFAADGSVRSIMGSITDISHIKWAQGLQNRRLQEAEETRRQQNEFIDITSHEMRNPLSAILQCADDISSSLADSAATRMPPNHDVVEACVESAQTISLCVQHQKSIVDDILTISKLDSNLLLITPIASQPTTIIQRAVRMFEPELQAKDIEVMIDAHKSYGNLAVDWVMLDPSRVLQVLINLMTNAIKFTAPVEKRQIKVSVGAKLTPPDGSAIPGFMYVPGPPETSNEAASTRAASAGEEWGNGQFIYIAFIVEDTGCGLTKEEKTILFQRFKQASPRTHAQYGGSGLGLFISKRLAELHGGLIGVASEAGKGSTFAFFVRARRTSAPDQNLSASASPDPTSSSAAAASSGSSSKLLPIERALGGHAGLATKVSPQRQDFAAGGPGENLVMTKAPPVPALQRPALGLPSASAPVTPTQALSPTGVVAPRTVDRGLDILVVEDNLINQRVLVQQLRKAGCNASAANDGLEALGYLARTHFCVPAQGAGDDVDTTPQAADTTEPPLPLSILLMDLEMPNMDGLTCVREIRRMQADGRIQGHVPVIAVTANVRDEQIATARGSGMDDVMSKPFRIPELLKKIEVVLERVGRGDVAENGGSQAQAAKQKA